MSLFANSHLRALNCVHKTMAQTAFRRKPNRAILTVRLNCIDRFVLEKTYTQTIFFYYTNIAFLIWWHWTEYFYFHPLFFYTLFISFTVFLLSGRFKFHFSPCFMPITTNNCTYRMESILCFCIDSLFLFLSSFPLSSLFVCQIKWHNLQIRCVKSVAYDNKETMSATTVNDHLTWLI